MKNYQKKQTFIHKYSSYILRLSNLTSRRFFTLYLSFLFQYNIKFNEAMMINRMAYKSQPMNLVHKTKHGTELWLGDYFAASNVSLLKQKDIKSVLTAAAMLGIAYSKDHQITHKTINAFDLPSYKMTPHFQEAFQFIDEALRRGHVLVHCAAGISRSTTFVLVYLMRAEKMSFKQALEYVRSKRSIICPNEGFQRQLKRYQLTVKKIHPKTEKEGGDLMSQSEQLQEKQAVIEFLRQEKRDDPRSGAKMNATVGSTQNRNFLSTNAKDYKGFLRGNSLNYGKKPNTNLLNENASKTNKRAYNQVSEMKETSKLANQFLTFKLQTPKIVTIKK